MLEQFADNIWISDGPEISILGFRYPTRMAVIRLSGGGVFVWSPVQLSPELRKALSAIGQVQHVIAPNSLHHVFLGEWQRTYAEAKLHAPPGLRKKRSDIAFDFDLDEQPHPAWASDIDQVFVGGNLITTEVVFFHRRSATVLFADLIQGFPADWFTGWRARVARLDLMVATEPAVPRKFRLAFANRSVARSAIDRIRGWPAERVLMAHGPPITADGQAFIQRAFQWLDVR